ncbi:MAG: hypothetical protein U1E27_03290, partial [Kiritimatiellia bacterium]|nr:hypothetical protein [Kiritimatiellia bacterium]
QALRGRRISYVCMALVLSVRVNAAECSASPYHNQLSPDSNLLKLPFLDIFVARPVSISRGPHTHSNPPEGLFSVERPLRGHTRHGKVRLRWEVKQHRRDYIPWDSSMPAEWRKDYFRRPLTAEWHHTQMKTPAMDEPLIIFAVKKLWWGDPEPLAVRAVYSYTNENIATILANMGASDRAPWLQGIIGNLAVILLLFSLVASITAFLAHGNLRQRSRLLSLPLFLVAAFMCWWYERGVISGGLRLDLLIIYPLLLISFPLSISALVLSRPRKREQGNDPAP